ELADTLRERAVGGHDGEGRRIVITPDFLDDAVVGGISPAALRVRDEHALVYALGEPAYRTPVEHHRDLVAALRGPGLEIGDQPPRGTLEVAPPSVGPAADHVVAVDDEPASSLRC